MGSNNQEREYKMEIDPKILRLLGPNLYTNIYYVLAELIANAYDADAENVYIISEPDRIIVEDDGVGMSYDKGIKKYLNVAEETRSTKENSYTSKFTRRIMGRKGVGKLSALSVSERVLVKTIIDDNKSGFVLVKEIDRDGLLESLPDEDIGFVKNVEDHGTSIIMEDPRYVLNKTRGAIKKNLLKIFPLISENFIIHIIVDGKEIDTIDNFDKEMISQLGCLITLGNDFRSRTEHFTNDYPEKAKSLLKTIDSKKEQLTLNNRNGEEKKYELVIEGWIGAYRSTRGRKDSYEDFPDNFISIFSNQKLGEYNILPLVGKNKLNEVYIVGQLHVDLFEETELPDMALSNRQGYKNDDKRYQVVIEYVRNVLLEDILNLRTLYAEYKKEINTIEKIRKHKEVEGKLRGKVDKYRKQIAENTIEKLRAVAGKKAIEKPDMIKAIIEEQANALLPIVGLKNIVDVQKKKILVSHASKDKDLADVIYAMLLFNGVPSEDIIYTSSEDQEARIPDGIGVFEYLRDFFIESYSKQGIYVVFITSQQMEESWGAVLEAGAGWVTKIEHKLFNIEGYKPQAPLDVAPPWHTTIRDKGVLFMTPVEWDKFAVKIERICDELGYKKRDRETNKKELERYFTIKK